METKKRRARRLQEIPLPDSAVGRLAQELRNSRRAAGLTQAQVADLLTVSTSAVQRAEAGRRIAQRRVVDGYVAKLGLDAGLAEDRWAAARRRPKRRRAFTKAPAPDLVQSAAELSGALVNLWEKADRPKPVAMEERVEPLHQTNKETYAFLSKSAADRITRQQQLPSNIKQLQSYLAACGVPESRFSVWTDAYKKIELKKREEAAAAKRAAAEERKKWAGWQGRTRAEHMVWSVGHDPIEPFPRSATATWAVRCTMCGLLSRIRIADILHQPFACESCGNAGHLGGVPIDLPPR